MKLLMNALFIILLLGVTFFGLGPVLMADGSPLERMITLAVVLLAYLIVVAGFLFLKGRK
ncbi:DUF6954 family protein [Bacillus marinisedimentorum]|uniref:DUF6954 family protein n=1 Tax=Bacillus marinisedimentorum TaxID=1821260 RepID=UPI0008727B77|nr:hypothetical protein [Bacillus marinisedimentorum]